MLWHSMYSVVDVVHGTNTTFGWLQSSAVCPKHEALAFSRSRAILPAESVLRSGFHEISNELSFQLRALQVVATYIVVIWTVMWA